MDSFSHNVASVRIGATMRAYTRRCGCDASMTRTQGPTGGSHAAALWVRVRNPAERFPTRASGRSFRLSVPVR